MDLVQKSFPVIQQHEILEQVVNARELHGFLGSKQQFADWIKNRIEKYDFEESIDFVVFHKDMKNSKGGRSSIEYAITVTMAKELAEPNFRLCFKINQLQNGKPQAYYEMTKDGFVLLAMGFTGKKAIEFKIDYINAFNQMADFILSDGINLQQQFLIADKEFKTATEIASNAGYTLNYVGKKVKPEKKQKRDSLFARLQMALPFFESKAV